MNREMKRNRSDQQQHLQLEYAVGANFGRSRREQQHAGWRTDRKSRSDRGVRWPDHVGNSTRVEQRSERTQSAISAPLVTSVKPRTWIALSDAVTPAELATVLARFVFSIQLTNRP